MKSYNKLKSEPLQYSKSDLMKLVEIGTWPVLIRPHVLLSSID